MNEQVDPLDDTKYKSRNMMTTSVPHFGVLKVGDNPLSKKSISPPTFIHGKHASILKQILEKYGINVMIVDSILDIDAAAIRKLLWVSAMWLLCHDHEDCGHSNDASPIDVIQVHKTKQSVLYELIVNELYPAALTLLEQYHNISDDKAKLYLGSTDEVMTYLESYSLSMPGAIPNKKLAIDEILQRNCILLSTSISQPLHETLIERVTKM